MLKWKSALFGFFLLVGLLTSQAILSNQQPKESRILADVTNSATIVTPLPTSTGGPTPSLIVTPTLTPTPTKSLSPTSKPSPTPTLYPGQPTPTPTEFPTPTLIAALSPTPMAYPTIHIAPTPKSEPEQYFRYSLFGYTSTYANVKLEGVKLLEGTKANKEGYFEFINFSSSSRNKEFCLTAVDTENLVSMPLCVPVPNHLSQISYGPYLLPPTLKLSNNDIKTNQATIISGKTIPKTQTSVYIFNQPQKNLLSRFIKPVLADSAKKPEAISIVARSDGTFTAKTYSDSPGKKRIFAQSSFILASSGNQTPKSVTLTLNILSMLLIYLIAFLNFLRALFSLNTIIFLQILVVLYILYVKGRKYNWYSLFKRKQMALVLYRQPSIVKAIINYTPITKN